MSPAIAALKRVGATEPVKPDFRGSFALAGYAGVNRSSWISQKSADRGKGPSELSLIILLPASEFFSTIMTKLNIICFLHAIL